MPNTREKLIELLNIGYDCPDGRNPFLEESCSTCPYGKAECCGVEMQADKLIANGVTMQKWIPVSERLPEVNVPVLVYDGDYVDGREFYDLSYVSKYGVTHWMPLPEPPKGE